MRRTVTDDNWTPSPDSSVKGESISYIPGLDGIRALAVLGVMLYHANVSWLPAGFLGVDTFFTLSGFLITSLLIQELRQRDGVKLGSFWARRARRLLPALLVVIAFCCAIVWFIAPMGTYPTFGTDAISGLFYVANWHFIFQGGNYFVANGAPSLLTHTWSLAIEEQFYIVWPLVLFVVWKLRGRIRAIFTLAVVGAIASSAWMAYLYHHGASLTRLYYGTDTHAQCLMVGAGLASLLALRSANKAKDGVAQHDTLERQINSNPVRSLLTALGIAGLVGGAILWSQVGWSGPFLYNGGFLVIALATAGIIANVSLDPHGAVGRVLSLSPLVFIGRISYGLYLWHFPLFQVISPTRTGLNGLSLNVVRFAATGIVAVISFYVIERPIRRTVALRGWRTLLVTAGAFALTASLVLATSAATGVLMISETRTKAIPVGIQNPVRVMLVGDSIAITLGFPLSDQKYVQHYHVAFYDEGILGCGVTFSNDSPPPCSLPATPGTPDMFEQYQAKIDEVHPNTVAILVGRWETIDQQQGTQTLNIYDAAFQDQVVQGLQRIIDMSKATGAHVVLFTTPCYGQLAMPGSTPLPVDIDQRVAVFNGLVQKVVNQNLGEVTLYNFFHLVCPTGQFTSAINGVTVRDADGTHIDHNAGPVLDPSIYPTLVAAGESAPNRHISPSLLPAKSS